MSSRDAAWLAVALPKRRVGVKGPRAAEALKQLGLAVPGSPNTWAPLRDADRDDSWNVVGRLGQTEFFVEERGQAAGIAALEQLTAGEFEGAYPVLREDTAFVLGGESAHDVLMSIDGREDAPLAVGDAVVVRERERPIRFVEPRGALPFWDLLRRKVELLPS